MHLPYPCIPEGLISCVIQIMRGKKFSFGFQQCLSYIWMFLKSVPPRLRCLTSKFKSPECIIFFPNVAPVAWGATNN